MNGHDQMRMCGFKFDKIIVVGRKLMDDESLKHCDGTHRRNEVTCEGNCTWETLKAKVTSVTLDIAICEILIHVLGNRENMTRGETRRKELARVWKISNAPNC